MVSAKNNVAIRIDTLRNKECKRVKETVLRKRSRIATVEQNIGNKETGMKIEENNGLLTAQHPTEITTFHDEVLNQSVGNMEERRLLTGELDKYLTFTHRGIHNTQIGMHFGFSKAQKQFAKTIQITIDRMRSSSQGQQLLKKEIEWIVEEFRKYGQMIIENKRPQVSPTKLVLEKIKTNNSEKNYHTILSFNQYLATASNTQVFGQDEFTYLRNYRFMDKCNLILGIDLSQIGSRQVIAHIEQIHIYFYFISVN
ncbi:MAG: hypothetical protein EZS28_028445, partial [Streblomastix strix]